MAQRKPDIDSLLATNRKRINGPRCRVCNVLDALPADWKPKIDGAFKDRTSYSVRNLVDILNSLGLRSTTGAELMVNTSSVERHRRGECHPHHG